MLLVYLASLVTQPDCCQVAPPPVVGTCLVVDALHCLAPLAGRRTAATKARLDLPRFAAGAAEGEGGAKGARAPATKMQQRYANEQPQPATTLLVV